MCLQIIYLIYMYKEDLALNNFTIVDMPGNQSNQPTKTQNYKNQTYLLEIFLKNHINKK